MPIIAKYPNVKKYTKFFRHSHLVAWELIFTEKKKSFCNDGAAEKLFYLVKCTTEFKSTNILDSRAKGR